MVLSSGYDILFNRTFKGIPDYSQPDSLEVGINQATPAFTDTSLTRRVPINNTAELVDVCDTADWTDSADAEGETTNTTTYKQGQNQSDVTALNLGKNGTASAVFSYNKTTPSYDGTDKELFAWLYIDDSTTLNTLKSTGTACKLKYGSDSSNYFSENLTQSELSTGWNLIVLDIENPDATTGSPVKAALDYSEIEFTTNASGDTIPLGKLIMDLWILVSADDYPTDATLGSLTLDETNDKVSLSFNITTIQANGFDIDGINIQNSDGTPKAFSISDFAGESKGETDELTIAYELMKDPTPS